MNRIYPFPIVALIMCLQTSAETMIVNNLSELKGVSGGKSFEYTGMATVFRINIDEMTIDDGSAFMTFRFDLYNPVLDVQPGEILHKFSGGISTYGTTNVLFADGLSLETISEYYTAELYPIVANEWEGFEAYPNRMAVFNKVNIADCVEQPGYFIATAANGSQALINKSTAQGLELGEDLCIVAIPRISSASTILEEVRVDNPVQVVKSINELNQLPPSSVFRYEGDVTVYYSDPNQGFVLDDGETFSHLAVEYIPSSQWPKPGEVLTGFTGRIKYRKEGSLLVGGTFFGIRANGTSIAKSGETRELVPIVAKEDEFFDHYTGRLSTYHNVEIVESDYATNRYGYMVKHPCGYDALLSQHDIAGGGGLELGKYESITCIPLYSGADPYPILSEVKLGNKAGVAAISSDDDKPVRYLDVYGRSYDAKPSSPGIYIEQYQSGKTRKVVM